MRTTTEVFNNHLAKRLAGELEADITENYSKDVVILNGTGVFKGHDGVRESAAELEDYFGGSTFEYKHTLIEGKYAFLEWTGRAKNKTVSDGADGFVIENGKITMQTIHYTVDSK